MKKYTILSLALILANAETVNLSTVEVVAPTPYAGSKSISRDKLDITTSKNHTITEALKTNPNVFVVRSQEKGIDGGEITPMDFSINGASFYQNNFQIDGMNFNNDIEPAGNKNLYKNIWKGPSLGSQAINLDTDLLESIEVIDSSVSAKYGSFQGGVVNAKTRNPKRKFSGTISYGYTDGDWTERIVDPLVEKQYADMTGWMDKTNFTKRRYRFGMEGYVTENIGLLFDYTRNESKIKYKTKPSILNPEFASFPDDERLAENYFLKAIIHADNHTIKPSILYSRQKNQSFIEHDINSGNEAKFGGLYLNLEVLSEFEAFILSQNLSYSNSDSSRYFDFKDGLYVYKQSDLMNWGGGANSSGNSYYGGLGDLEQKQKDFSYKADLEFNEYKTGALSHRFLTGLEFNHMEGSYKTANTYRYFSSPTALPSGFICQKGDRTCVNDNSFRGLGQYQSKKAEFGGINNKTNLDKFAIYLEDELSYDRLKIRPGLRAEYDTFTKDFNVAPRLTSEYEFIDRNFFGLGLNRYYGRNLFSYKIFNTMYSGYKDFERTSPNTPWKQISQDKDGFADYGFKTPYDDELSIFYHGQIDNFRLALKYIKRKSKDEIVVTRRENLGLPSIEAIEGNYKVYTNGGKTNTDIVTFTASTISPYELFTTKNHFEFSATWMDRDRNFQDYRFEVDRSGSGSNALYHGKVLNSNDLPIMDDYPEIYAKFSHIMEIPKLNLTISNFLNYEKGYDILVRGYNSSLRMSEYFDAKIDDRFTWDMRIAYDQKIQGDFRFFANLDINNITNEKFKITGSTLNNEIYYDYGIGRNVWLEAGLKW